MKYLLISSLLLISIFSSRACDCYDFTPFCEVLSNAVLWQHQDYSRVVCYVEYTGNSFPFLPDRPQHGMFEVKVIDLFYGEIQPGQGNFLNTDSTFWVVSGSDSCDDIFILEEGDYAIMATSSWVGVDYDFSDCYDDLQIFSGPLPPAEYSNIVQEMETCWNAHCEEDLVLSGTGGGPFLYQGATISSRAYIDGSGTVYKAKDRITLERGFWMNDNSTFRAEIANICD